MKANELRFGNYVYDTLGKVNKIDLEAITYIAKEPHNQVKPIPLTEEWLFNFGFEKVEYSYRLKKGWHWIQVDKCSYYIYGKQYGLIDHVHQLQNLYFALTAKELTFKSE